MQLSLKGQSNLILNPELTELMIKTELAGDYALGIEIKIKGGEVYFGHSGGNRGFRCLMWAHESSGVGAVVMTNNSNGCGLAVDIIDLIGAKENWPGY